VFFLIVSLIETLLKSPPFLVSVSAVSLSTRDLMPDKHPDLILNTEFIYGLQIMNSLVMLSLAIVGIYMRSKLHLGAANLQMKLLIIVPAVATVMVVTDCTLSFLYLERIYELHPEKKDKKHMAYTILIGISAIMILMQVALCLMMRKVYLSFKESLEQYIDFLLMFEETPRSKIAKKYLPPMDVLEEETTSMFNETVRTSSRLGEKFRLTSKRPNTNMIREHSINSYKRLIEEEEDEIDHTPNLGDARFLQE